MLRLVQAPHLAAQTVARVPKYASLLFRGNLRHLDNPRRPVGLTLKTGTTWFWSRSRQELWNKGATSGNMQEVKELWTDCDSDTLLVKVDSPGPACHTGNRTCFFKRVEGGVR